MNFNMFEVVYWSIIGTTGSHKPTHKFNCALLWRSLCWLAGASGKLASGKLASGKLARKRTVYPDGLICWLA